MLFITGCEHKEILKGKREDFFSNVEKMKVNKALTNKDVHINQAASISTHIDVAGNRQHNAINYSFSSDKPKIDWTSSVGGASIGSDIIYFKGKIYSVNSNGELTCIDVKTGKVVWRKLVAPQKDGVSYRGGISIIDGAHESIVVTTNTGEIVKFRPFDKNEQRYAVGAPIKSNPIIIGDKIIVTTVDNQTYAFSAQNSKKHWERAGSVEETIMDGAGTGAIYGNNLISAYTNGDVVALDINDGSELWTDTLFSSNTSESGFIISHIVASPVVSGHNVLVATSESKITLVEASSGIRIWENNLGTINTPIIMNDWAFVLSTDNMITCISMVDGSYKWMTSVDGDNKKFGPMIINGNIVVFSQFGDMMVYNPKDGKLKETKKLGTTISKTPIIVNKNMYIVNNNAEVVCLK